MKTHEAAAAIPALAGDGGRHLNRQLGAGDGQIKHAIRHAGLDPWDGNQRIVDGQGQPAAARLCR